MKKAPILGLDGSFEIDNTAVSSARIEYLFKSIPSRKSTGMVQIFLKWINFTLKTILVSHFSQTMIIAKAKGEQILNK